MSKWNIYFPETFSRLGKGIERQDEVVVGRKRSVKVPFSDTALFTKVIGSVSINNGLRI